MDESLKAWLYDPAVGRVAFLGYVLGIVVIATAFGDRLGGLAVALGAAGAGAAFALASVTFQIAETPVLDVRLQRGREQAAP